MDRRQRSPKPKIRELRGMRGIILPLCILAGIGIHAQNGPRLGLGLATQSVGGLFRNTSNLMPGPIAGWHFEGRVHRQVSIMPEILYMTKGFTYRNPALATRTRASFNYAEVPILFKIYTEGQDGLYLLGGPSLGYFINGRFQQWQDGRQIIDGRYQVGNNIRRLQFSGLVGMGFQGPRWAFDVRAQTSLTPFDRFVRIQNVVYGITFAYRIKVREEDE